MTGVPFELISQKGWLSAPSRPSFALSAFIDPHFRRNKSVYGVRIEREQRAWVMAGAEAAAAAQGPLQFTRFCGRLSPTSPHPAFRLLHICGCIHLISHLYLHLLYVGAHTYTCVFFLPLHHCFIRTADPLWDAISFCSIQTSKRVLSNYYKCNQTWFLGYDDVK